MCQVEDLEWDVQLLSLPPLSDINDGIYVWGVHCFHWRLLEIWFFFSLQVLMIIQPLHYHWVSEASFETATFSKMIYCNSIHFACHMTLNIEHIVYVSGKPQRRKRHVCEKLQPFWSERFASLLSRVRGSTSVWKWLITLLASTCLRAEGWGSRRLLFILLPIMDLHEAYLKQLHLSVKKTIHIMMVTVNVWAAEYVWMLYVCVFWKYIQCAHFCFRQKKTWITLCPMLMNE